MTQDHRTDTKSDNDNNSDNTDLETADAQDARKTDDLADRSSAPIEDYARKQTVEPISVERVTADADDQSAD